ncbi:MAG: hypothetical protein ACLSFJ_06180 [Holdemania filiformis]
MLVRLAKDNKDIVAVTPAMITGSKLEKFFAVYPERAFDCGIAEEHAATFCAGLAISGKRPFISLYSHSAALLRSDQSRYLPDGSAGRDWH